MSSFMWARAQKVNKYARLGLIVLIGGIAFGNTHFSVKYLSTLSGDGTWQMTLAHYAVSVGLTVFCFVCMGFFLNPAFWSFMTEELGESFKKLGGMGAIAGTIMTFVLMGGIAFLLFWCYRWDLETTHFGLGLGQYPLLSIYSVPTFFFVFAPDVGAIAWNVSNVVDTKTRSLRANPSKPTQRSVAPQSKPAARPAAPAGSNPLAGFMGLGK